MRATTTVDGRVTTYHEAGDGGGHPILLVHGYTGSADDFDPVLGGLAMDRRVVAVDLPGHGGSEGPDDEDVYGLTASSAWLLRFADAVGLDEFHLLGHSMGGLVVQRTAAAASQRLYSLVLMATGLGALREEACDLVVRMAVAARDHGIQAAWREVQSRPPRSVAAAVDPVREEFVRRRFMAFKPAALVGGARNLIAAEPLGAFLRGIDIPVLVIHGEHDDAWTPAEQALLARTIRRARHVVVPGAVHSPQWENTDYWLKSVRTFLSEADGSLT
ncbi:MAG: alpha/beta fold hydrolase [Nitriliruptorales bacterium]|nr:alpha/beta fold hydrolase [Nitriliruptorales bacterium]